MILVDKPISTFADRLNKLMEIRHLKKADLARLCGIDRSNITRYCQGSYEAKQDVVYSMAAKLNINPVWLMGYDVPMVLEPEFSHSVTLRSPTYDRDIDPIYDALNGDGQKELCRYGRYLTTLDEYRADEQAEPQITYIKHFLVPAAAGYASPIEGEDYEEIPLPDDAPANADFCITIQGDSMEPYIKDGSLVYVKRGAELREFEPGIFFVDGDVYCKQWAPGYAGENYLLSANPKRQDANITIYRDSGRNCVYFGKVLLRQRLPQPEYV